MEWRLGGGRGAQSPVTGVPPAAPPPEPSAGPQRPDPVRQRLTPSRSWLPWIALTLVGLLAAGALWRTFQTPARYSDAQARAAASPMVEKALEDLARQPPAAATAYAKIAPSLVVIRTSSGGERGLGTGFVANADGTILTANHVIDGGGRIEVTFADGTKADAEVASAEPERDLATLTPSRLPAVVAAATLGAAGPIGSDVHAVGNPLGLTFSLSSGVISATGRTIDAGNVTLKDLLQFDAAVNPGNSGGPLIDDAGRVVGVVTALANPSRQNFFVGLGFAVPIDQAGGALGAAPM